VYVVVWGDVVARYLHRVGPGGRDYLRAVVLVIGGVTGDIELAGDVRMRSRSGEGTKPGQQSAGIVLRSTLAEPTNIT